jgi:D-alanyl-D-alanine carboxypeptidase (penicillin-binding protein 5/6)
MIRSCVAVLCLLICLPASAADLESRLQPLISAHRGKVGLAVKHLKSGESFTHRADEPMPTASLIKFPVMIEAYRQVEAGQWDLAKTTTLSEQDKAPGSGILTQHFSAGVVLPLRDCVRLMIAYSDNTATNLVIDQIGLKATNELMDKLDCPNTRLHAKVFRPETSIAPDRSKQFGLGSTTAAEMVRLYEKLHARELVSRKASDAMLEHLARCQDETMLAQLLPKGTKIAHKTGYVAKVRTDAGIIETPTGPVAIAVLTAENEDTTTGAGSGNRLIAQIGKEVYDRFAEPAPAAPVAATSLLKVGARGDLVIWLQRTLNARLEPSPAMTVDGEFGTVTEAAVKAFQKFKKLDATGIVNEETWQALGTLVTREPPIPEPEVVNKQELKRQPAEAVDGPPHVTCKAWAVADGRTGKVLHGHEQNRRLDFASTTKMMTAYVVLELAKADAKVLDEPLVFSQHADDTVGSTADVRAGERLTVGEALYGLMLPSGNDAATALAEHFGSRFEPEKKSSEKPSAKSPAAAPPTADDAFRRFVAEMNRTAKKLGMNDTHYANPHGLTVRGHVATASDLARLAAAAMQNELFRKYVNTRQHGCTVTGPGGYRRNIVWENTNKLLAIEGYNGVKTGTTTAAGACLVSYGTRGDRSLIVVVLGAVAAEARYTDTRNLFRWAWNGATTPATKRP